MKDTTGVLLTMVLEVLAIGLFSFLLKVSSMAIFSFLRPVMSSCRKSEGKLRNLLVTLGQSIEIKVDR